METIQNNNFKVIFIDWSVFVHRAIFSWRNNKAIPPEYTCLNMIIASLRRIGINKEDKIFLACDGRHSWRKDIAPEEYKKGRKQFRESFEDIPWQEMWKKFNSLLIAVSDGTGWQTLRKNHIEADDWMAVGSRVFKDSEVILVTSDADMEQLAIYPNVKLYSPLIKYKGGKGGYKIIDNPYKILAKKVEKEASDGLESPILSSGDFEKRKMIVSLIELPEWVEGTLTKTFDKLKNKTKKGDLIFIPYKGLKEKLRKIYTDRDKTIDYNKYVEYKKNKRRKENGRRKKKRRTAKS